MSIHPTQTEVPFDELQREVSAIVSGWDGGFHTRSNNEHTSKRVIPITSQEILDQLRELKNLCNKANLDRLFRLITTHANNHANPHQTDLSQFATDILHLLHAEYTNRGGVATYDVFLGILFEDYQIAGLDDVFDGTNPKLLTTVKHTAKYILQHNEDENAHLALFKKMFPGDPVHVEPSAAIMAMYEIGSSFQKNRADKYTYIGKDGYRRLNTLTYLPIDFMFGTPTVACFGDRTNKCEWSRSFDKPETWDSTGLVIEYADNAPSVNKNFPGITPGATLIKETIDTEYKEHILKLKDRTVFANTISNYSFDVCPIKARYICLRIIDKTFGIAKLAFINFEKETTFITTNDNTMYLRMIKLAENYYHVEYSVFNDRDSDIQIQVIPYISSTSTQRYQGTGQELMYIDNASYEDDGIGCSPFIYTNGTQVTRHGIKLEVSLDGWFNASKGAFVFDMVSPITMNTGTKERTLYSFRNLDYPSMVGSYAEENIFFTKLYNESDTQIFNYPILANKNVQRQLAFGYGTVNMTVATTGVTAKTTALIAPHRKDATVLHIGHNGSLNPLDGYFKGFTFYRDELTPENITFLAGE